MLRLTDHKQWEGEMRLSAKLLALTALVILLSAPAYAGEDGKWYDNFSMEFGVTALFQGVTNGGSEDGQDQTDFAYSADVAFSGELAEGHTFNLVLEAGEGEGAGDNFDTRATPNYDAIVTTDDAGVSLTVAQAYYEGTIGDIATLVIGKIDVHSMTDNNEYANDETSQFLNSLFVRSVGTVFAEHGNYYVPGIYISVQPIDLVSVTYTYSHDGGEDLFDNAQHWIELGLHPQLMGLPGNYRIGFIKHDIDFTEIKTGDTTHNTGFNISADQALSDNIGVFFRYASQDDTLEENEVISAMSGGLYLGGGLWGMEKDGAGVAYGKLELNKDIAGTDKGESVLEVYYSHELFGSMNMTADIQMYQDLPDKEHSDVMVMSLRVQTGF